MKLGEKISKARKNVNLTQDQLAELLEVTRQTISKWESDLAYPETAKIAKLSDVLKVSCDYLLKENETATTEITMTGENSYVIDWAKLYPVLSEYQNIVDFNKYKILFNQIIKEAMFFYNYSLDDAVLVIKDIMYKEYLELKKEKK